MVPTPRFTFYFGKMQHKKITWCGNRNYKLCCACRWVQQSNYLHYNDQQDCVYDDILLRCNLSFWIQRITIGNALAMKSGMRVGSSPFLRRLRASLRKISLAKSKINDATQKEIYKPAPEIFISPSLTSMLILTPLLPE